MRQIAVRVGRAKDNDSKCFDGDSLYISGSFENTLVRLVGIDVYKIGSHMHLILMAIFFGNLWMKNLI
jgi:hypothetical protein